MREPGATRIAFALAALLGATAGCRAGVGGETEHAPTPATSIAAAPRDESAAVWTTPRVTEIAAPAEEEPEERDYAGKGPWVLTAVASSQWLWGGDLHTGAPGIGTWTSGLRLGLTKPCVNCAKASFRASYEHRRDSFEGGDVLGTGSAKPWGSVHTIGFGAGYFQPLSERWAVLVAGDVGFSVEQGADLDDGFSLSGTFGVGHRVSRSLDVGAGVVVISRFAEDVLVFGGPQFDWTIDDAWQLQLDGAELHLRHEFSDALTADLFGGFQSDRFRLRSEAPGFRHVITDSRLPVTISLRWRPRPRMELDLRAGFDIYRNIVLEDQSGDLVRSYQADRAPFVGLRWILQF